MRQFVVNASLMQMERNENAGWTLSPSIQSRELSPTRIEHGSAVPKIADGLINIFPDSFVSVHVPR
jgi:hypothetical protein